MIAKSIIFLIKAYQFLLSPLLGQNCRFYPPCSHYAIEAVDQHGCVCGGLLAVKRIVKCQPFHPGGLDPVPGSSRKKLHPQNPELN